MRNPFIKAIEYRLQQTAWARGGVGHRRATVAQLRAGAKKILDQVYSDQTKEARKQAA
jgi:hypothetical protein